MVADGEGQVFLFSTKASIRLTVVLSYQVRYRDGGRTILPYAKRGSSRLILSSLKTVPPSA
jgi:hypothetical protein